VLECFSAAVIDPKGPKHFSHFVPSPFSEGLPTRRRGEELAPNLVTFMAKLPNSDKLVSSDLARFFGDKYRHTYIILQKVLFDLVVISSMCKMPASSKLEPSFD
jgi:hypothetical protein